MSYIIEHDRLQKDGTRKVLMTVVSDVSGRSQNYPFTVAKDTFAQKEVTEAFNALLEGKHPVAQFQWQDQPAQIGLLRLVNICADYEPLELRTALPVLKTFTEDGLVQQVGLTTTQAQGVLTWITQLEAAIKALDSLKATADAVQGSLDG